MKKIVIIDDSEHFLEILRTRLLNYGYENFMIARSANEGLYKIKIEKPDIAVVSTKLSDMDGFMFCQKIKEIAPAVSVILMTGMAERADLAKAKSAGADDYAVKTFDCLVLLAAIKKAAFMIENPPVPQEKIIPTV